MSTRAQLSFRTQSYVIARDIPGVFASSVADHLHRYLPTVVAVLHLLTVVYLTATVGFGLFKSWRGLNPSQDIRPRLARRTKLLPVFAGLSALGLLLGGYSTVKYVVLSYQVWADKRGVPVPDRYVTLIVALYNIL